MSTPIRWTFAAIALESDLIALPWIKRHARIYADDDDSYLTEFLVPAAVETVERDTGLRVNPVTASAELPAGTRSVRLPASPFVSAVVKAVDDDDNETVIAGSAHDGKRPGVLEIPAIEAAHKAIRVAVTFGPQPPAPTVRILIATLVAHWFEHPEAVTADGDAAEVPLGYQHLVKSLQPYADGVRVVGGE